MPAFGFSRFLFSLLAVLLFRGAAASAGPVPDAFTSATTSFLQKYVSANGDVNYAAIKKNPAALQALLKQVQQFDAKSASSGARKAFYLNAYNLVVIGAVVDSYPLSSVMKVPGFFDKQEFLVAGEKLTLNNLETSKLRKPYDDPRIHFALVCAARSCPPLRREAYATATVEQQLAAQARQAVQDPRFIRVDAKGGKVLVSEIFKWYADDFQATGKPLLAYLNQFRGRQLLPLDSRVDYYSYDWTLNDRR
ncbi:DUF547 domain-containing protein [Hymenobacter sp. BT175]|uniref:DUF547 domain-containing protein n=1 Tax=Hymenobacter translucens TaxID=2886507 RepID=UPI001D0F0656|nr:DUF547 domain-containing protein [Hymenobacter translucens]MCC2545127.1 DUF547 domain-containing protein [Hymenobacter translucens]